MNHGISVAACASVLVVCGCGKSVETHLTTAPPAVLDSGWSLGQSRDGRVTIAIPPGWHVGADTPGDNLKDLAASIGSSNGENQGASDPSASAQMQSIAQSVDRQNQEMEAKAMTELEKKGIVVNVINGSKPTPGEERTRFYVKVDHSNGAESMEDAIDAERNHYAFPPKPVQVKLPIGVAQKFSADDSLRDGMTLHQISYVVVDGGDTYTLRFVTEEASESIQGIADSVAGSLRIIPSKRS